MGKGEGSWGGVRGVGWGSGAWSGLRGCGGVGKRSLNLEESKNDIHLTKLFPGR